MKVYFLGTGTSQGIPIIGSNHPVCNSHDLKDKRLRSSIWVEWDDVSIVIDCGPDFRQQMLKSKCNNIDAIFLTHEHSDHCAGIDDIRPYVFKSGPMQLYSLRRVLDCLKNRYEYIFNDNNKYPGAPSVVCNEINPKNTFKIKNKIIQPLIVNHANLSVLGFRINDFTYITDMHSISDAEKDKIQGSKILVLNALRKEPHSSHLHLEAAINFANEIGAEKTFFTHISHRLGFHEKVNKELPDGMFLAYDNLILSI